MIKAIERVTQRTLGNRSLLLLLFLGLLLTIWAFLVEVNILPKPLPIFEIFMRFFGRIGEILLLAFIFGLFFDYGERLKLIDDVAEKLGFLATASRAGIRHFYLDASDISHEREILDSEKFVVCLRGSRNFFIANHRSQYIIKRLNSGKEVEVVCEKTNISKIQEIRKEFAASGACIDKFKISCISDQSCRLMYNYLWVDEGIWIKTYWINRADLLYAAPAFFVETNTELWKRYERDIEAIKKVDCDGAQDNTEMNLIS